ncbi:Sulfotransferase domain protein [Planktothrix sp. PCC 11201]|uniref:sulfotransferase n=1 Tax=Planktothrix sp. PCC 11201 TaxID=1729650 RepID=UPI0009117E90|nr:sulfotransferase [Planktothrix sp. PCC 11201]SKB13856.1 Sulfotransferase domain protein [Planktothrix sp. PCC 11201]
MQSKPINNMPDEPYLDLLDKVDFNPIFIMGDHRSGTTALYQILVATECFNYLNAYQIIKYDELLDGYINGTQEQTRQELEQLFNSLQISDRLLDEVKATPDLPEEYGFILKNSGYESYLSPENLKLFTQLCKKIKFISSLEKPLLLKNPWCFPNFIYIKSVIPKAKFVFIHRHPLYVMNSKLKAVRLMLSVKSSYIQLINKEYKQIFDQPIRRFIFQVLYSGLFNLGLRRVTQQSLLSTSYFLEHIKLLPIDDYISIRYEDLCQTPELTILKILNFLKIEAKATLDYRKLITPRSLKLLPEVQRSRAQICSKLQAYLTYCSYQV